MRNLITSTWIPALLVIGLFSGLTLASPTIDLGTLPSDGTTITYTGSLVPGELDPYTFAITEDITNVPGTYLNIQTYGLEGMEYIDTVIGLYDSSSQLIASDDDDNSNLNTDGDHYGLYSLLSFGPDDPYYNDGYNSPYGAYLGAGNYTLVVTQFGTNLPTSTTDRAAGIGTGDNYVVQFSTVSAPVVPVPSAILLAGPGVALLARFRRRLRRG